MGEIFAMIIESCHDLIPPEDVKPVVERIISNFVTEYCPNQHITVGLNTIREILTRMPLALDESQIEYLVAFRTFKNSSVTSSAKSLVNFFRDVCPELLPKKFRGRFTQVDDTNREILYGEQKVAKTIAGTELLKDGENIGTTRILTDEDLRKMKLLKLKAAVKKVDRHGFRSDSESEVENIDISQVDISTLRGEARKKAIE